MVGDIEDIDGVQTTIIKCFDEEEPWKIDYTNHKLTIDGQLSYSPTESYAVDAFPHDFRVNNEYLGRSGSDLYDNSESTWVDDDDDYQKRIVMFPGPITEYRPRNSNSMGRSMLFRHYMPQYRETGELSKFFFLKDCIISYSQYAGEVSSDVGNKPPGSNLPPSVYMGNYARIGVKTELIERIRLEIQETERNLSGMELAFKIDGTDVANGVTWFIAKLTQGPNRGPFPMQMVFNDKVKEVDAVAMMKGEKRSFCGFATMQFRATIRPGSVTSKKGPSLEATMTSFVYYKNVDYRFGGQTGVAAKHVTQVSAELYEMAKKYEIQ